MQRLREYPSLAQQEEGEEMGDASGLGVIGPWDGGEQRRKSNLVNKSLDPGLRVVD